MNSANSQTACSNETELKPYYNFTTLLIIFILQ